MISQLNETFQPCNCGLIGDPYIRVNAFHSVCCFSSLGHARLSWAMLGSHCDTSQLLMLQSFGTDEYSECRTSSPDSYAKRMTRFCHTVGDTS